MNKVLCDRIPVRIGYKGTTGYQKYILFNVRQSAIRRLFSLEI